MHSLQIVFILFTFLGPPALWLISRWWPAPLFRDIVRWTFAVRLSAGAIGGLGLKIQAVGGFSGAETLPMHLCDWAVIVTLLALVSRARGAFELAYCWGIAGTAQALFTPAIEVGYDARSVTFL